VYVDVDLDEIRVILGPCTCLFKGGLFGFLGLFSRLFGYLWGMRRVCVAYFFWSVCGMCHHGLTFIYKRIVVFLWMVWCTSSRKFQCFAF